MTTREGAGAELPLDPLDPVVLDERIAALEARELGPRGAVDWDPNSPFRPALWQQNMKYSAVEDRAIIAATVWPGVMGVGHLQVRPRAEGPNLSVDVDPGIVCVPSPTVSLSRYVCQLTQKVNLAIGQGPAAGNQRFDTIAAVVTEVEGSDQATWELDVIPGPVRATGVIEYAPLPPMAYALAPVGPIVSDTVGIQAPLIGDWRRRGNAAPLSAVLGAAQELPETLGGLSPGYGWGAVQRIPVPAGIPIMVTSKVLGSCSAYANAFAGGYAYVRISLDDGGTWVGSVPSAVSSNNLLNWVAVAAGMTRAGLVTDAVRVQAMAMSVSTNWLNFLGGYLETIVLPIAAV